MFDYSLFNEFNCICRMRYFLLHCKRLNNYILYDYRTINRKYYEKRLINECSTYRVCVRMYVKLNGLTNFHFIYIVLMDDLPR